eukprot:TRINITY_DN37478_c0_g1_i1.p1 TRINITY_DN37478_c0_g1~~TRINITY_DN37478_c0_g1_i1.p1  ORF type:complete len:965 (-),score=235.13 TRINITY_DN37478_c0_g1_i1:2-2896(-)
MASEITQQLFLDWRQTVGVRQIQRPYEKLASDAGANGRSIQEEMKAQGFKDYHAFSKSCPRFSLLCWPVELAELGSGCVLYFHFLSMLAIILLLAFLLQIPAMLAYGAEDNIGLWKFHGNWQNSYQSHSLCVCPTAGASTTGSWTKQCPAWEQAACAWNGDDGDFLGVSWLTPGNFGPSRAKDTLVPLLYLACVAMISAVVFVAYQLQTITDRKVDGETTQPNDFAVLVRGLPTTATDESVIKTWFEENAVKGKVDTEVVKVVIAWDASEFRQRVRAIKDLRKQISELDPSDERVPDLKREMARINEELASSAPDRASRLRSSGLVVVIFRRQSDHRACLDRWSSFWARRFYRDPETFCCANSMPGAPLPKFPIGDTPVCPITVERAANPGDINWEELGVDPWVRRKMLLRTNGIMFLLIVVCFGITYGFNKLQEFVATVQRDQTSSGSKIGYQILSMLPALAVGVLNAALSIAANILGQKEYYDTVTEQEFSQALKMSIAMIVNTGFALYFNNAQPSEWYLAAGLVNDVFFMLLFNTVFPALFAYFDMKYLFKSRTRSKLTQEKLDELNDKVRSGTKAGASAEDKEALAAVKREIEFFKAAFTPSMMRNTRRYAGALKTFFCCLFFSPVLPFVSLIGFLGLLLQYLVDKYMLLRWFKRPPRPPNAAMCQLSTKFVKFCAPLGFSICVFIFLAPSWADKDMVLNRFIIMLIISGCTILLPMSVTKGLLELCFGTGTETDIDDAANDYYKAQYMWSKEMKYHKDQFMYKGLPESKNPEFFSAGADAAVKMDDVKGAVAAGTTEAIRSGGSSAKLCLRGGKVIHTEEKPTLVEPGVPATMYGAGSGGGDPIHVAPASGASAAPAAPAPLAASGRGDDAPSVPLVDAVGGGGGGRPTWQFELSHGNYKDFADDCQDFLERRYQEFLGGKRSRFTCNTSGKQVSIDLDKMTSKVVDSHKIRAIRRTEP